MPQIRNKIKTKTPESDFDRALEQELLSSQAELAAVLNKGLVFDDNFRCDIIDVSDSGSADSLLSISHDLKRAPAGFIVINISKAGIVYDGGTTWTTTMIYLKCNNANSVIKLLVF